MVCLFPQRSDLALVSFNLDGLWQKIYFYFINYFFKETGAFLKHPAPDNKYQSKYYICIAQKNYFIVFLRLIIVKVEIYFLILYLLFFVNADAYFEQFMPYQQDEFLEKRSPLFKLDKEIYRYKKSANQNLNVNRFLSFFYRRFRYG